MCHRVTAAVIIIIALILAIIVSVGHHEAAHLQRFVMSVIRFFDIMIPVLGAGALVKYLMGGNCHCHKHPEDSCGHKH